MITWRATPASLDGYDWSGRTGRRDRAEILNFLGIRRVNQQDKDALVAWLRAEVLPAAPTFESLLEQTHDWFARQKIEPPSNIQLQRLLNSTNHLFERELVAYISALLSPETKASIDALLNSQGQDIKTISVGELRGLTWIDHDPGRVSLDTAQQELAKLIRIRQVDLPIKEFVALPSHWLQKYYRRASIESTWELHRHPNNIHYTLVAVFCWQRQQNITDNLVDLLIQAVHKISNRAEKKVEKQLFDNLRQVRGKPNLLFKLAEAAVDQPDGVIKEVLYPLVRLQTLEDLVKEFKTSGKGYQDVVHTVIHASYSNHYRRMLPPIVDALEFFSNNMVHQPVIKALELLKSYRDSGVRYFACNDNVPIDGVIKPKWRDLVVEQDGEGKKRVNRINYEIGDLQALRDRLRSKEIWVKGAHRYRNPDEDLPKDFEDNRVTYCDTL